MCDLFLLLFQSYPLWLQYLEFVEEQDTEVAQCTGNGIAKMRALFEQALSSTGLHYVGGGKVWKAYRDYESALLLSMAEASVEVPVPFSLCKTFSLLLNNTVNQCLRFHPRPDLLLMKWERAANVSMWCCLVLFSCLLILTLSLPRRQVRTKQVEVVRNLFHRQLTVPLADHAQILEEYKKWEQEQAQGVQIGDENDELAGLPSRIAYAYQKAEQMSTARDSLESNISPEKPVDGSLLQHYLVCAIWYMIIDCWLFDFGDWKLTSPCYLLYSASTEFSIAMYSLFSCGRVRPT